MKENYRLEMLVYRLLGVPLFRKAVMQFEKIKNRKDKSKNVNYHLSGADYTALKRFCSFMSYNALLHIMSICFIVLYKLMGLLFNRSNIYIDLFFLVFFIFNIYCIMLQRYNYIHILRLMDKLTYRRNRRVSKLSAEFSKRISSDYLPEQRKADLEVLIRLRDSIKHAEGYCLSENDYVSIERMANYFSRSQSKYREVSPCPNEESKRTVYEIADDPYLNTELYTKSEKRVKFLQRLFARKNTVLNADCTIITENYEQDFIFRRLFPNVAVDAFEITLESMIIALKNEVCL